MKKSILIAVLFLISTSLFSQALKKTQVLVLGTPHLEQLDNFQSSYLKNVLDSLQEKQFDVVAIKICLLNCFLISTAEQKPISKIY